MCTDVFVKLFIHDSLLDLTEKTRTAKLAYEELGVSSGHMVHECLMDYFSLAIHERANQGAEYCGLREIRKR